MQLYTTHSIHLAPFIGRSCARCGFNCMRNAMLAGLTLQGNMSSDLLRYVVMCKWLYIDICVEVFQASDQCVVTVNWIHGCGEAEPLCLLMGICVFTWNVSIWVNTSSKQSVLAPVCIIFYFHQVRPKGLGWTKLPLKSQSLRRRINRAYKYGTKFFDVSLRYLTALQCEYLHRNLCGASSEGEPWYSQGCNFKCGFIVFVFQHPQQETCCSLSQSPHVQQSPFQLNPFGCMVGLSLSCDNQPGLLGKHFRASWRLSLKNKWEAPEDITSTATFFEALEK